MEEIKYIVDYIMLSNDYDGVVVVIECFVLGCFSEV